LKAFDTANDKLLVKVLKKYGAPPKLLFSRTNSNAIHKSHKPNQYLLTGRNEPKLTSVKHAFSYVDNGAFPFGDDSRSHSNI
jgi:hypothetical protein